MTQPTEPTTGDLIIEDLERQLSEPDPRYGRKCRELAVLRVQYTQLMEFVRSKKDVLGLVEVGADGQPLENAPAEEKAEGKPEVNGKAPSRGPVKAGT